MTGNPSHRRRGRLLAAGVGALLLAAALGLAVWADADSSKKRPRPAAHREASLASAGCPGPAAAARSRRAVLAAERRFLLESEGATIHRDLRQIAHDRVLVEALRRNELARAAAEA